MTEPALTTPDDSASGALGPDNEVQLERLQRVLKAVPGFQVVLLEIPEHPIRRTVIDRVLAWSAEGRIGPLRHLTIDPRSPEQVPLVDRLGHAATGAIVDGLDSLFVDDATVDRSLGALNWYRESLRALEGPLILVLSPRGLTALMARAPDFATWRSHTCRIAVPHAEGSAVPFGLDVLRDPLPDPLDLDVAEAALEAAQHKQVPRDLLARLWLDVARARGRASDPTGHDAALATAAGLVDADVTPATAAWIATALINDDIRHGRWSRVRERLAPFDGSRDAELPTAVKAWLALSRAELAGNAQDWSESASHARQAVELADRADVRSLRLATRLGAISIGWHRNDPTPLRPVAEELVTIAATPTDIVVALQILADIDIAQGRLDLAFRWLERALGTSDGSDGATKRAEITRRLAHISLLATAALSTTRDSEQAARLATLAMDATALAESNGDPRRYQAAQERQLMSLARSLDRSRPSIASDVSPARTAAGRAKPKKRRRRRKPA